MAYSFTFDAFADGSLVLTMDGCCIRTAAQRAHRELVAALVEKDGAPAVLGGLVTLLDEFMCPTDFSALRAHHQELAGGTRCQARLFRRQDGHVAWEMVGPR